MESKRTVPIDSIDSQEVMMPKGKNQKLKLYYLSRIMLEKTDEEHELKLLAISFERRALEKRQKELIETEENRARQLERILSFRKELSENGAMEEFDAAVFDALVEKAIAGGREVWTYSCCFPEEGWWINKFVDMPFIRSRLMEWVCALTGAKGFLHWGFNYYGSQLYGLFDDARFKGDGHIVYPDPEHKKYNLSARFINTRDGIQDVEAYLIRREDDADLREVLRGAAENYYTYDENPETFEERLKALLGFADRARF
jgi:hypothetical protein